MGSVGGNCPDLLWSRLGSGTEDGHSGGDGGGFYDDSGGGGCRAGGWGRDQDTAWGIPRGRTCRQAEDPVARGRERLEEGGAGLWEQRCFYVRDAVFGDVVRYRQRFFRREHDNCE